MEPRELLQALMDREKLNPNSLAAKLKAQNGPSQPQLYKFLKGIAKEPRRSTLQAVADHYSVPLDAFYDPAIAEQVMFERGLLQPSQTVGEAPPPPPVTPAHLTPQQLQLLRDLDDMAPSRASKFLDAIHEAAEEAREVSRHQEARRGKVTAAARRAAAPTMTAMTWGDGNERQGSLTLATVRDPFTAAPGERESALYRRIKKAPKK